MYIWIFAGCAALAAAVVGTAILIRRSNRAQHFQKGRPLPGLKVVSDSFPAASDDERRVRQGLESLAAAPDRQFAAISRFDEPADRAVPQESATSRLVAAGEHAYSGTVAANTGPRHSTWQNRRLFSDFQGIMSDDGSSLATPMPEELPIGNDEFVFGSLTPAIAQLLPETPARRHHQRQMLAGAGYHSRASWLNLTATRFVLAFLALVITGFWLIVAPETFEPWLLGLVVMAPLLMWALPPLFIGMKASERKIYIEHGLPDVLDMLNMCVSQGLTVPQSLKRIGREIAPAHPALSEELRIVNYQAEVGSLPQALRAFSQRIDSTDVSSFTSLLIQSEATGTSISHALTEYSDSIRSTLKERADARANSASFKLLFPVALCLMPSVFLFLLGPAIVEMSDFFGNRAQALENDRQNAMNSLQQQPRLDLSRFRQ